jgi:hypothetical protein
MSLIRFRCWKCRRKYAKAAAKIGTTFKCSCDYLVRVPKKDGGNCRVKTVTDYVVEAVLCGGGGALLGFLISLVLVGRFLRFVRGGFWLIPGMTIACGLIGFFGGERAIDYLGDMLRENEKD